MGTNISRRQVLATGAALAGSAALMATSLGADAAAATTGQAAGSGAKVKPTIVLVHGGYADSSCWNDVIARLQRDGYTTIAGSNPLRGIPTDAPYIGSLLDSISGPVVLVAHSMGGTVITNAAAGKSNVKALVYIAAFVPDVGETQADLISKFPGSEVLPVSVPIPYTKADGTTGTDLYLSKDGQAAFAADISVDDVPAPAGHPAAVRCGLLHLPDPGRRLADHPVVGTGRRPGQGDPGPDRALDVQPSEVPQGRRSADLVPRRDAQPPEDRRGPHRGRRQGDGLIRGSVPRATNGWGTRGQKSIHAVG